LEIAMEYASGSDAMKRVEAIDNELEMYELMRNMPPEHKVNITEDGLEHIAEIEAERAEIISKYLN
jgi:hypothetical protein